MYIVEIDAKNIGNENGNMEIQIFVCCKNIVYLIQDVLYYILLGKI